MPQRPTTHKVLHRAAIGFVFALAFALVYIHSVQAQPTESAVQAASKMKGQKAEAAKLVKNEPAKPVTVPTAKAAHAQGPEKTAAPVTEAKSLLPLEKAGKLRAIPLSTLNGEKTAPPGPPEKAESKQAKAESSKESAKAGKTQSKESKEATDTKTKGPEKAAKKAKVASQTKQTFRIPRLNNGLVPPPPPIMPGGMDVLGMYGQPVDYLSMKELEGRKKELSARFNELDSTLKDSEKQIKDRQDRAQLFESLYQEGVVSRKELEVAKKEAGDIDRDLQFKQDEFDSVKGSMKAVNDRLAVLKKMEEKQNGGKATGKKIKVSAKQVNKDKKKTR